MSRVPVINLRRSLRTSLALGAMIAGAAVLGGSAFAETPTEAAPDSTSVDDLSVVVIGATTAGEALQWVDPAEAAKAKPDLPEISQASWLPAR